MTTSSIHNCRRRQFALRQARKGAIFFVQFSLSSTGILGLVSIKDVAAAAGVSDKTVSRVVNREPNVKPAMAERVQAAIDRLGYVPNQAARLVRTSRSRIIGLITDVVSTTPNSVELIRGIQDRVARSDHSLLIANTSNDPEAEARAWRTFREHRIDGLLFASMYHRDVELREVADGQPCVLVNCFSSSSPNLPAVLPDDYQGGYAATQHVIARGHSRIAYLSLHPEIMATKLRGAAFRDALRAAGLPIEERWIVQAVEGPVGKEQLCVDEAIETLLRPGQVDYPTAILCGDDEIALQAVCILARQGIRIPEEIAVVGFDDFQMISTSVRPRLTTVALPYYQIGMEAAEILLRTLAGEPLPASIVRIPCPVIQRESI